MSDSENTSENTQIPKTDHEIAHDKVDDWEKSTEFEGIEYSTSQNKYWCPTHKKFLAKGPLVSHLKSHGVKTSNASSNLKHPTLEQLQKEKDPTLITTPTSMIYEDISKDIAEAAGMLAKDYELRAEFEMLHQKDLIPWDWSFYDWIKIACVDLWNKQFGYSLELKHDLSVLDSNQKEWLSQTIKENMVHKQSKDSGI